MVWVPPVCGFGGLASVEVQRRRQTVGHKVVPGDASAASKLPTGTFLN